MAVGVSQRVRWTVGVALALAAGAVLRYPGGTPLDASSQGYSIPRNFLSDLGMTVAYDGQPNKLGASLLVASLCLLVLGLGGALAAMVRLQWRDPAARRWLRGAVACGFLACTAFAGVAVTPENRVMPIHVGFTVWAWRVVPLVAACMALASVRSSLIRRRVALVWTVLALLLAGYAALLAWGPSVTSTEGLRAQVLAQKAATVMLVLALLYLARETDSIRETTRAERLRPASASVRPQDNER
jgi:hypothetical membrane protein